MNIQAQIMAYAVKERRHAEGTDGLLQRGGGRLPGAVIFAKALSGGDSLLEAEFR